MTTRYYRISEELLINLRDLGCDVVYSNHDADRAKKLVTQIMEEADAVLDSGPIPSMSNKNKDEALILEYDKLSNVTKVYTEANSFSLGWDKCWNYIKKIKDVNNDND